MESRPQGPPGCSCGRDTVLYQCILNECPNFSEQKFYCVKCAVEHQNHKHRSEEISSVAYIAEVESRWTDLQDQFIELHDEVRVKVKPLKNLLAFLNDLSIESKNISISTKIHADLEKLAALQRQVKDSIITLEELKKNRNLQEFKYFDKSFETN